MSIADHDRQGFSNRWRTPVGAAVVLATFGVLCGARFWRPGELFTITENIQIGEARAWWNGRLDLPERKWDSALFNGKVYSHFPPMFSLIAAITVPIFGGVPHWFVLLLVAIPVLILAYRLFLIRTGAVCWACVLAIGLVCGTSVLPVMDKTLRGCGPYFVNQSLATVGVLVFLGEYFGRRRVWIAALGVTMAALSRQLCVAYFIPLTWMVLDGARPKGSDLYPADTRRMTMLRRGIPIAVASAVAFGLPLTLNHLKFGSAFDSGYMHVYEGRKDDVFARNARTYGLFAPHYVPRNLWYANLGPPEVHGIEMAGRREVYLTPNLWGTGVWWTTPLLLFLFVDFRRLLTDPTNRALVISLAAIYLGLMVYHSTGYEQRGFNRYSLDYVPALLAMIAPACVVSERRRWMTIGLVAWSVLYFALWLPQPNIRIW